LIEPFDWPVRSNVKLDEYPGEINLANELNDQAGIITLKRDDALAGVTGSTATIWPDMNGVSPTPILMAKPIIFPYSICDFIL